MVSWIPARQAAREWNPRVVERDNLPQLRIGSCQHEEIGEMMSNDDYIPPKVWKWEKPRAGEEWRYSGINRPVAGPTHQVDLPIGKHPLQLYSRATPNGVKVTVMLEELLARGHSGAEYDAWLIDHRQRRAVRPAASSR
jgi:hypothetical protein